MIFCTQTHRHPARQRARTGGRISFEILPTRAAGSKFVAWFESSKMCLGCRCCAFFDEPIQSPTPRPLPLEDRAVFLSHSPFSEGGKKSSPLYTSFFFLFLSSYDIYSYIAYHRPKGREQTCKGRNKKGSYIIGRFNL